MLIFVGGNKDITPIALTVQRLIYNLTQRESQTLADFPLIFGATTLMSIPPVIVYFALQRYIVQGSSESASKVDWLTTAQFPGVLLSTRRTIWG